MQFRPVILIGDDQVIQNLFGDRGAGHRLGQRQGCLLYTSDAADEL